jgi:xanthine dehydrogenase accessory factor
VVREARRVIADGTPRLLLLGTPGQFGAAVPDGMTVVPISCQSEGALEVYIEPVVPAPQLVIVGRSPMAQTLADLARALDWRTKVVAAQDFSAADADERSMVIVATQGHGDEEAVEQGVAAHPAYLGLVGSRRRGAAVLGYLADRGVPGEELDRVHVPAGLDLGHTTHQEIAVAILAELVQLRASGALAGVGAKRGGGENRAGASPAATAAAPAAGMMGAADSTQAAADPAEATDPVCGMTVPATPAGRPLIHDGVTYYFCCSGCRQQFEKDPAAYAKKETRC